METVNNFMRQDLKDVEKYKLASFLRAVKFALCRSKDWSTHNHLFFETAIFFLIEECKRSHNQMTNEDWGTLRKEIEYRLKGLPLTYNIK